MSLPRKLGSSAALSLMILGGLAAPATAADPGDMSDSEVKTIEVGMKRTGFNAATARANGYEVRTAPDGRQYSVKPGTKEPAGFDEVIGDCGSSFIQYDGTGSGSSRILTGYTVRAPVVFGSWEVFVVDAGGTRTIDDYVPRSGSPTWSAGRNLGNQTLGSSSAEVVPGGSSVELADGEICTSGGPNTTTNIF